jgi:FdhD protein
MDARQRVSAAVLAGGRSRRMGSDKRELAVGGVPLLARAVAAVQAVADDVQIVVGSDDDPAALAALVAGAVGSAAAADRGDAAVAPLRWQADRRADHGPLAGLEVALTEAAHDVVVVLAGDHPRAVPAVLRALVALLDAHPDATAAALGDVRGPNPLVAAYRRAALPSVRALLDGDERRATRLLDHLDTVVLARDEWLDLDPSGTTAVDLDTPEDARAIDTPEGARAIVAAEGGGDVERRTTLVTPTRFTPSGRQRVTDRAVIEEPLELRVCGPGQDPVVVTTTLRTPGHDVELAVGWLFAEGLLAPGDLDRVDIGDPLRVARPDDQLTVHLRRPLDLGAVVHRHAMATASCGVCGRASIDELAARCRPVANDVPARPLPWRVLAALPPRARDVQAVFATTGGLHAAALADRDGGIVTVREDVGRHNALDAAIGVHVLADDVPLGHLVGLLSGRVGFELVAKAAVAGLPVLAAVGAPTDLAIRTAERLGITLIGFLRDGTGNVYTHPHRIAGT